MFHKEQYDFNSGTTLTLHASNCRKGCCTVFLVGGKHVRWIGICWRLQGSIDETTVRSVQPAKFRCILCLTHFLMSAGAVVRMATVLPILRKRTGQTSKQIFFCGTTRCIGEISYCSNRNRRF